MTKANETSNSDAVADSTTSNHVYILSKEYAWLPGRLVSTDNESATVQVLNYKNENDIGITIATRGSANHTVRLSDYPNNSLPLQNVNEEGKLQQMEDMVDLPFLHEAAILGNLKLRHANSLPYTRTGSIVIAVNPYKWIPSNYSQARRTEYSQKLVWDNSTNDTNTIRSIAPHVYEVSALAYKGLAKDQMDQAILVSGESGAGKTETVKICMNHIAGIQDGIVDTNPQQSSSQTTKISPIVQRILDSNPLLEAFGNAKTIRNDNSSRFGKFIQLQFDGESPVEAELQGKSVPDCRLAGSQSEVYLLEKSRVVGHNAQDGERTFHIFYQLLAAPDAVKADIWEGLSRTDNESFAYVGCTETTSIEGKTDGENFAESVKSLELIGIEGASLKMLLQTICVVLQLGNIAFEPMESNSDQTEITSKDEFKALADLLGVESDSLSRAFTERTIVARGETMTTTLSAEKAQDACHAFAKEIYSQSFLWLVQQINAATCAEKNYEGARRSGFGTIGLLDIFGFESFKTNGFSQLCINYANEKLQQKFTKDIFSTVMEEYQFEGIELEEITYDDNTGVLNLIEGRTGLLAMLNEECVRPNGNDATFVRKAISQNKTSSSLIENKMYRPTEFGINHFAGPVAYNAESFVNQNTDTVPKDLKEAVKLSCNAIIAKYMHGETISSSVGERRPPKQIASASKSPTGRTKGNIASATIWTKFKFQLTTLMGKLDDTQTRYIRCIKPNTAKEPLKMEHLPTVEQLRCAGVVAAVTISRSAFPNRMDHHAVLNRFKSMWPANVSRSTESDVDERHREDINILLTKSLKEMETTNGSKILKAFVIGNTRTYFRAGALELLETRRFTGLEQWAAEIQKIVRGKLIRIWYQRQRCAAISIQRIAREYVAKNRLARQRKSVIKIQALIRMQQARKVVLDLKTFAYASKIQCVWRMHVCSKSFSNQRSAAMVLQKYARRMIQMPKYRQALIDKRDENDMSKKLEKMKKQLEEEQALMQEEKDRQREVERIQAEESRQKIIEAEKKQMKDEMDKLKMEKELLELKNQVVNQQLQSAVASSQASAPQPAKEASRPESPVSPPLTTESGVSVAAPVEKSEPEVKIVEVIKYVEKEVEPKGPIMTKEQQALMKESGKIIDYLRNENVKMKKKCDHQKRDFATLKENNVRLMEANESAGGSFQSLNQHAKNLNTTNQKLLKTVAQYRNKISELNAEMKRRQSHYKEVGEAYKAETEARSFYESTMLDIVDAVTSSSNGCDKKVYDLVMEKAVACASVSHNLAGKSDPAPALVESDGSVSGDDEFNIERSAI